MNGTDSREAFLAAESTYADARNKLNVAEQAALEARVNFFTYTSGPGSREDKDLVRPLLLELADETSPFGCYARHQNSLRPIIDSVVKLFGLVKKNDAADGNFVFKIVVACDDNNPYVVTMEYSSQSASIVAEPLNLMEL